jgi:hypothetical protein
MPLSPQRGNKSSISYIIAHKIINKLLLQKASAYHVFKVGKTLCRKYELSRLHNRWLWSINFAIRTFLIFNLNELPITITSENAMAKAPTIGFKKTKRGYRDSYNIISESPEKVLFDGDKVCLLICRKVTTDCRSVLSKY